MDILKTYTLKLFFRIRPFFIFLVLRIVILIVSGLLYATMPLVLPTCFAFYIFRCFLKTYVKWFKRDFGNIVEVRSNMFVTDAEGESPRSSIVKTLIFDGRLEIEKVKRDLLEKVKLRKADGTIKYPELQQKLEIYRGYPFWRWDKGFSINNHVTLGYNGVRTIDEFGLNDITAKMLKTPFDINKSPWEVSVLYLRGNRQTHKSKKGLDTQGKSIFIVRYSHVLADGFTLVELVAAGAGIKLKPRTSKNSRMNIIVRNVNRLISVILAPYQITSGVIQKWDQRILKPAGRPIYETVVVRYSPPIPVAFVKDLKTRLNTSFSAILIAAFTAGVRKLMLENMIEPPEFLHAAMPFPMTGHRDELRNRMKIGALSLPVGMTDARSRLNHVTKELESLMYSRLPSQVYYLSLLLGVLPVVVVQLVYNLFKVSVFLTIFDSPINELSYDGQNVVGLLGAPGLHHGNIGVGITCISFNRYIRIQTNFIESEILSANKDALISGVMHELVSLKGICGGQALQQIQEE